MSTERILALADIIESQPVTHIPTWQFAVIFAAAISLGIIAAVELAQSVSIPV